MIFDRGATCPFRAFALIAALACAPSLASAQTTTPTNSKVDGTAAGIIGLSLIGAEAGLIIPTVAGLDETWSLIVFPSVGAGAGALGGYFLFGKTNRPELAVGTLVLGIAMVIPTLVITISQTRYSEDDLDTAAPAPDATALRAARLAAAGPGALRLSEGRLLLGVPGIGVVPSVTRLETQQFGDRPVPELRVALFSGSF